MENFPSNHVPIPIKEEGSFLNNQNPKNMSYKNKTNLAKALVPASYVDFDPKTELKEEGDADTLIISLPGFKKEQLSVQVSNTGILKIFGEKPENPEGTIKHRFVKETKVANDCNVNEIRAKFIPNDELRLTMPKKAIVQQPHKQEHVTTPSPAQPKPDITQMPKASDKMDPIASRARYDQGDILDRLQGRKSHVGVGIGVAMVVMVGIGAYVAYNYGSNNTSYSSFMEEY